MGNSLTQVKEIISSGIFPTEYEFFQGADLIISNTRHPNWNEEGKTVIISRHAGSISWLVFQLKEIYSDKINAGNKYEFYPLIGDIICAEMNDEGDIIQAMLNVVDEIEQRMK